jgi:hypothetical protein
MNWKDVLTDEEKHIVWYNCAGVKRPNTDYKRNLDEFLSTVRMCLLWHYKGRLKDLRCSKCIPIFTKLAL